MHDARESRLERTLRGFAHDILSANSTIKTLALQLKEDGELVQGILAASARAHALASRLQRYLLLRNERDCGASGGAARGTALVVASAAEITAIVGHRLRIPCAKSTAGGEAAQEDARLDPHRFGQALDLLAECAQHGGFRPVSGRLSDGKTDAGDPARAPSLVLEISLERACPGAAPGDSIALLLCEALLESMGARLEAEGEKIRLFMEAVGG